MVKALCLSALCLSRDLRIKKGCGSTAALVFPDASPPLRRDDRCEAGKSLVDSRSKLLRVQAADRMLDHDQVRLDLSSLSLRRYERLERLGRDHDGEDAALTKFDAVVETPR
jgi:hypothetical protein